MNLHIFSTQQQLSKALAQFIATLSAEAITARGQFSVALSGGAQPKLLGNDLTVEPYRSQIDWLAWHVFWADERFVPLDDPDSNYRLAREQFLDHIHIPQDQLHTPDVSMTMPDAAAAYEAEIRRVLQPEGQQLPRFDLILLGMGGDGHTASLFPGHELLQEREQGVAPIFDSPKPPPERLTLTLPVINNARRVAFTVTGSSKADVLPLAVEMHTVPAGMARPVDGELDWFIDEAAAAKLRR